MNKEKQQFLKVISGLYVQVAPQQTNCPQASCSILKRFLQTIIILS